MRTGCDSSPAVAQVLHPGLPGAPGHELWRRDFTGACSLFGVEFQPTVTAAETHRFVEALELFGIGASWGGFESLAVPTTGFVTRTAGGKRFAGPMVRIHIGLEDPDDLIADLRTRLKGAARRAALKSAGVSRRYDIDSRGLSGPFVSDARYPRAMPPSARMRLRGSRRPRVRAAASRMINNDLEGRVRRRMADPGRIFN